VNEFVLAARELQRIRVSVSRFRHADVSDGFARDDFIATECEHNHVSRFCGFDSFLNQLLIGFILRRFVRRKRIQVRSRVGLRNPAAFREYDFDARAGAL
jgi:hypothetical protein